MLVKRMSGNVSVTYRKWPDIVKSSSKEKEKSKMLENMLEDTLEQLEEVFPKAYETMRTSKDMRVGGLNTDYLKNDYYLRDCLKLYKILQECSMLKYQEVCEYALAFMHSQGVMLPATITELEELDNALNKSFNNLDETDNANAEGLLEELCKVESEIFRIRHKGDTCLHSKEKFESDTYTYIPDCIDFVVKHYQGLVEYLEINKKALENIYGESLISRFRRCMVSLNELIDDAKNDLEAIKKELETRKEIFKIASVIKGYLDAIEE